MNKTIVMTGTAIGFFLVSLGAQASHGYGPGQGPGYAPAPASTYVDYARVVSVKPIYRRVEVTRPHRECWYEQRPRYYRSSGHDGGHTREIVGGIIGGALGSRLGKGKGRKLGAAVGIVMGAHIANKTRDNNQRVAHAGYEKRRICRRTFTRHTEERIDGYSVKYVYKGFAGYTRMDSKPGKRIRIRVSIDPES